MSTILLRVWDGRGLKSVPSLIARRLIVVRRKARAFS